MDNRYELILGKINVKVRRGLSFFFRLIYPSYGYCGYCKMPWLSIIKKHTTLYSKNSGCFPLCEGCWQTLTIEQRLPYYKSLWLRWSATFRPEWNVFEKAVKEGK